MSEAAASSNADDAQKAEKEPVDYATLAFMLRESADIVEKGEFDVILYHALQDFRTYYKFHLPKHKARVKKKQAKPATESDTAMSATSPAEKTAASPADPEAAASSSADAPNEAGSDPAGTPAESAEPVPADPPQSQPTPEEEKPGNAAASAKRDVSAGSAAISEGTASTATSATAPGANPVDPPPASAGAPQADEPESAAEIDAEATRIGSADSLLNSTRRVSEEFIIDGRVEEHEKPKHSFATPLGKKVGAATKGAASKISAGVFATGGKIGKKLTKIHLPTSGKKKSRESGIKDLTGGDVAQYAESSKRRNAADNEDDQQHNNYYHHQNDDTTNLHHRDDDDEAATNVVLQAAVTGLGATEPVPSTATTARDEVAAPVDRVRENHFYSNSGQPPPSSRGNENALNAAADRNNSSEEPPPAAQAPTASSVPSTASASASSEAFVSEPSSESFQNEMPEYGHSKPTFQRPKNNNSAVVANGWVEQHRRSKMRTVWKEVLASLVEGRRPGEETTLWIQRETINPTTNRKELEVLHQIPVKLLEGVVYPFTTDDRFSLKLYNSQEDFVFRCNQDPSAAMKWVTILQQYEMETKQNGTSVGASAPSEPALPDLREENAGADANARAPSPTPARLAIRDLRAICHGAGINTAGMERADLERAAAEVQQRGTYFAPPTAGHAAAASIPPAGGGANSRSASPQPARAAEPSAPPANAETKTSIKDLRAICHGAGISTVGMERGELERAAAEVHKRGTYFAPPAGAPPADDAAKEEEMRRRQAAEDEARRRAAEEEHWRRHEEETRRRAAAEEEHRRREEEHRRRAAEEEHRRRIAEQQAAEQRHRYAKQQAAWHHQQQQEEQRRRMAEQQAAEQRRRHEEAIRKQQQWAGQQAQHQSWTRHPPQQQHPRHQHQQQQYQQAHAHQWQQHQQWQQQQHQRSSQAHRPQQHYQQAQQRPQAPPPPQQQQHAPPPQQHPPRQESKYAKMANQSNEDDGQAAITKLKHDILIQWALQPPQMQTLRSVDVLVSTIQNVFPPALGVPAHDYFKKWKAVTRESVLSEAGIIDEEKIKKAVRKLRFFLHPDKLPKDLNSEQQFTVKMLWDITNDALEEYQKSKEDLDWIG